MNFIELSVEEAEERLRRGEVKVCLWGLGRTGSTLACLLASLGVNVMASDSNPKFGSLLASGEAPYQEPGLGKLLKKAKAKGRLGTFSSLKKASSESQIIVSTISAKVSPSGSIDYSSLERFCSEAGLGLNRGSLLLFTGILPPGIMEDLVKPLLEERSGLKAGRDFGLAYSPLKASPGSILNDLTGKPQILAGLEGKSLKKAEVFLKLFSPSIVKVESLRVAEAAGLFQEVLQDVKLALANELILFCSKAQVSFRQTACVLEKISSFSLQPSIGCGEEPALASKLLAGEAERMGVEVKLVKTARKINEEALNFTVRRLSKLLKEQGKTLSGSRIILLGVSSKADVKEDGASPARLLASALKRKGAKVKVWDPLYSVEELKGLGYEPAVLWEALPKADCVIVTIGHQAFKKLKTRILSELSAGGGGILFDCSEAGIFAGQTSEKVVVEGLGF